MSGWQPIETAPKDRKVDLWCKRWCADTDEFIFERFADCRWDKGDSMCNRPASWGGFPNNFYHPVCWMEIPTGPTE